MKKAIRYIFLILVLAGATGGGYFWFEVVSKKINIGEEPVVLFIRTGDTFEDLFSKLEKEELIENKTGFKWLAEQKNLPNKIYPGRYTVKDKMTYNQLIDFFRGRNIDEVDVTFNSIRTVEQLSESIAQQIEANEDSLLTKLTSKKYLKKFGLNPDNVMILFIPNTYRFYWNTNADEFITRMAEEFKKFWTPERKARLKKWNITQTNAVALAAVVQAEQSQVRKEWKTIAGLYLNRVRLGWKLQSDPTVVFANKAFELQRVRWDKIDRDIDSPYNTYRYAGIPPGPIVLPEPAVIDAVLYAEEHKYMYMCAKGDGSHEHNFAKTYAQHKVNQRKYWAALDKAKIH